MASAFAFTTEVGGFYQYQRRGAVRLLFTYNYLKLLLYLVICVAGVDFSAREEVMATFLLFLVKKTLPVSPSS